MSIKIEISEETNEKLMELLVLPEIKNIQDVIEYLINIRDAIEIRIGDSRNMTQYLEDMFNNET